MKRINLFIASLSMILLSCGSSDNTTTAIDNKPIVEYPSTGSGTFQSPYRIGSGIYQFKGEKYYSIDVIKNECNVLIYGVKNFDTFGDLEFIDDSHSNQVSASYDYLYQNLAKDGYDIIVNSDTYSTFGIFSPCIDDDYAQSNAYVELEAGDRVTMSATNVLYKFTITRVGSFILNTTSNDVEVRLYDHNMQNVYFEVDNKHEKVLQSGDYYVLLSKSTRDDVNFVFDFSAL